MEIFKDYNYRTLWVLCIYTTALSHVASQFKQHPKLWVAFSKSIKQSLSFALEQDTDLLEEDADLLEEDADLLEDDVDHLECYALLLGKIITKLDVATFTLDSKEGKMDPIYVQSLEQINGLLKHMPSLNKADVFKDIRATIYQVDLLKEKPEKKKKAKNKGKATPSSQIRSQNAETARANEKKASAEPDLTSKRPRENKELMPTVLPPRHSPASIADIIEKYNPHNAADKPYQPIEERWQLQLKTSLSLIDKLLFWMGFEPDDFNFSLSGSMRVAISISESLEPGDTDICSKVDEETLRGILNFLEKNCEFHSTISDHGITITTISTPPNLGLVTFTLQERGHNTDVTFYTQYRPLIPADKPWPLREIASGEICLDLNDTEFEHEKKALTQLTPQKTIPLDDPDQARHDIKHLIHTLRLLYQVYTDQRKKEAQEKNDEGDPPKDALDHTPLDWEEFGIETDTPEQITQLLGHINQKFNSVTATSSHIRLEQPSLDAFIFYSVLFSLKGRLTLPIASQLYAALFN